MSIERPDQRIGRDVSDWWKTDIIDMSPGVIRYYGYPIEDLIGNVSFAQMIWLMVSGELTIALAGKVARCGANVGG